jgi:hypothetical protein
MKQFVPSYILFLSLAARCFAQLPPAIENPSGGQISDQEIQSLIAYGQLWDKPDQFYASALPFSRLVHVASMRSVRFMTDRALICLEASRAKLLMRPFGIEEARKLFVPGRLRATLEVESMSSSGARYARKHYGGQINLILVSGDDLVQPAFQSGTSASTGDGVAISQVSRIMGNLYAVNTLGFMPGMLTRGFAFKLSQIPNSAEFILVRTDGKKERFRAQMDLERKMDPASHALLRYAPDSGAKAGKPITLSFSLVGGPKAKGPESVYIVEADSVWRTPIVVGQVPVKVADVPVAAVFRYHESEDGGVYRLDFPTTGLEVGRYELRVRVGDQVRSLPFGVK